MFERLIGSIGSHREEERKGRVTPVLGRVALLLETGHSLPNEQVMLRLIERAMRALLDDTGAMVAYIALPDADDQRERTEKELVVRTAICRGTPFPPQERYPLASTVEGAVYRNREIIALTRDRRQNKKAASRRPGRDHAGSPSTNLDAIGTHPFRDADCDWQGEAMLCLPLLTRLLDQSQQQVIGTLTVRHLHPGERFGETDMLAARQVAGLIANAITNADTIRTQQRGLLATLEGAVTLLEAKDPSTTRHSHRVREICTALGRQMALDSTTLDTLRTGAMLHDIGKIGVPASLLNKPGNLTAEEFEQLKRYPLIGYEMCRPLALSAEILMLIRNHAEKLDGTGYPDGLRQGQIPIPLRILCVADAFDAMSSYRPYRKSMDARERNEQLNRFAGTQFDPTIVETLKSLLHAGDLDEIYGDQWNQNNLRDARMDARMNTMPTLPTDLAA